MLWNFIDKVYIITLSTSTQRQDELRIHLQEIGLHNYEFIVFDPISSYTKNDAKDIECSIMNIFSLTVVDKISNNITHNHLKVVEKAYQNNFNRVLILEDDARFMVPIDETKITSASTWIERNYCDMFYFGYCVWPLPVSIFVTPHIVKIPTPYCAHCYLLTRPGMQKILKYIEHMDKNNMNIHVDKLYTVIPGLYKYGIFPNLCFQSEDPGLYKRALKKILPNELYVPFNYTVRTFDYISVVVPIVVILILCFIIMKMITNVSQKVFNI
jgi:GR25 family glycosyltransferase involved in LPS biosynthesis